MKTIILTSALLAFTFIPEAKAQQNQNTVFGVWETARVPEEGEDVVAHIKVYPCKNNSRNACGKIVWSEREIDPRTGKPALDSQNSEESLRSRPILCLEIMTDFKPTGEANTYDDGEIYSSKTGKTYSGEMKLVSPNKLSLRGSVLLGLIGRTTTWKRVTNPKEDRCN